MNVGFHDSESSTRALTLDFPLNFNTLDHLTAKEIIHTTHEIDSTTNQRNFAHDTASFVSLGSLFS